jgi:hypothetical protein
MEQTFMREIEANLRKCWMCNTFSTLAHALEWSETTKSLETTGFLETIEIPRTNNIFVVPQIGDMLVSFRVPIDTTVQLYVGGQMIDTVEAVSGRDYFTLFGKYPIPVLNLQYSQVIFKAECPTMELVYYYIMNTNRRLLTNMATFAELATETSSAQYVGFHYDAYCGAVARSSMVYLNPVHLPVMNNFMMAEARKRQLIFYNELMQVYVKRILPTC